MKSTSPVSFRESCGATGPLTLEATAVDGAPVGSWSLEGPFAVVGRDARNDVVLPDEQVSSRHVYLQVLVGRVFWVDLESRAGVTRGGIAESCGWLSLHETIRIGPYRLRVTGGVPPAPEGEPSPPDPRAWRLQDFGPTEIVTLVLPNQTEWPEKRFTLTRMLTLVGRSEECRLRMADDHISRFLAAIVRTGDEAWVVDLLSRQRLRVNKGRARWSALAAGDAVDFGPRRVVVRFEGRKCSPDQLPALLRSTLTRASPPAVPDVRSEFLTELQPAEGSIGPLVQQFGLLQQQMFEQFQQVMQVLLTTVGTLQRDQMGTIQKELEHIREITQELQSLQTATERASVQPSHAQPAAAGPSVAAYFPHRPDLTPNSNVHLRIARRIAELQNDRQGTWQRVVNLLKKPGVGETAST